MTIAIPSYRRPAAIQSKTLAFLERMEVDSSEVTIFVANSDELMDYRMGLFQTQWVDRLVVAEPGISRARNFIHRHYPVGTEVLFMDDDVRDLVVRNLGITMKTKRRDQSHYISPREFRRLVRNGFDLCHRHGTKGWGVYSTNNPMHMRPRVFVGLTCLVAAFFGFITDGVTFTKYGIKEDVERSLRLYQRYGSVVKIEGVGMDTAFMGGKGGLHDDGLEARYARERVVIDQLVAEFPGWVKIVERPKYRDIKLARLGPKHQLL